MNSVHQIGNLTADPEHKTLDSGTEVTEFSIALNSKRGEQDRVDYFDVVTFGKQASVCAQYLSKGKKVAIEGRLEQQRWETSEGSKRSRVKIIAQRVTFLTPAGENGSGPQVEAEPVPAGAADDDIPF